MLVIGGTRFIGLHTVMRLVDLGHEVAVFHRGETEPAALPAAVEHLHGDRSRLEDYREAFENTAPNIVIDMVPLNGEDAEAVVETFDGIAPWIIGISSQDVYGAYGVLTGQQDGPIQEGPLKESAPLRAELYPYRERYSEDHRLHNYDKIPAERVYLSQIGMYGTVLRLPAVYGPGDYQHRMWPYLRRMIDGRPVILMSRSMAEWRWTRGYVENIADAIALAVTRRKSWGRIYNLGEPDALTEKEWVEAIGRAVGWDGEVVVLDDHDMPEHLRSEENLEQSLVADTSRIRNELKYAESIDRDEAIRRTVDWEQANPNENLSDEVFDYAAEDAALG